MEKCKNLKWMDLYKELEELVEKNPDIIIHDKVIEIPSANKSKFYFLFDMLRDAFIKEEFTEWLKKAELLSTAYLKVEQDLIRLLDLKQIFMPNNIKRFLNDPLDQLRRGIFDLLFDLIGGETEIQDFIIKARDKIDFSFRQLYKQGFNKWIALALLKQFEPDEIFHVPLDKLDSKQVIKRSVSAKEVLPFPIKSKDLYFEIGARKALLTPDAIIHSAKMNKYVSFRTELGRAMWQANSYSDKREWYSIRSLMEQYGVAEIRPDILIYIGDNMEDIALIADSERICRPDILVECIDDINIDDTLLREKIEQINLHYTTLNPTLGGFTISKQEMSKHISGELKREIKLLDINFQKETRLESIVKLAKYPDV